MILLTRDFRAFYNKVGERKGAKGYTIRKFDASASYLSVPPS